MIEVKLIKKAMIRNVAGSGLTTWILKYPRFIHSEFCTHRMFSRNAASSRAIPIGKMIRDIVSDPAEPLFWGRNQKGMQAVTQFEGWRRTLARFAWRQARWPAVVMSWLMSKFGLHKQTVNRLGEPHAHITVIMTTGHKGLANFFGLRAHKDAQPEFQVLAWTMLRAYNATPYEIMDPGTYYVPMAVEEDKHLDLSLQLRAACGRIARVSYLTHDGVRDSAADIDLCDKLVASGHWSPMEHIALALSEPTAPPSNLGCAWWSQYRKGFVNECRELNDVQLARKESEMPDWVWPLVP